MKKLLCFLPLIVFVTLISCDDEPIDAGIVAQNNNNINCQAAVQASAEASLNFAGASEENYEELCLALASAIENQINVCGDDSGELQSALDALDCTVSSELCANAIALTEAAQMALQNATPENYTQLCNAYATALQAQINACGDPDGELQDMIFYLGSCS
jgi:uncharacterized alpha-E superfamily protein